MIKRVVLENWKSHGNSEFDFEKGTNVIVGSLGSGKSSVMDAICYSLFGTFPALNNKRVTIDEVIMAKPNKMDTAKVKMQFSYNNKEYTIERIVKRKGTNEAAIYCNGRLVAGPKTSDVNQAVERELEITYDLFSRAVYSEQNHIDFFLRLNPSQRKEKFDELLALEKYEKARSSAVSTANRIKTILQDKKKWLQEIKEQISEQELADLTEKAEEKEKKVSGLEKNKKLWEQEIEKTSQEKKSLEKKERDHRAFHELLVKTMARIEEQQADIKKASKLIENRNEQQIAAEIKELNKTIEENKKAIAEKEKSIENTQKKLNNTIQEIMLNHSKMKELEKQLEEVNAIEGKCPLCRQELAEKTKHALISHSRSEQKLLSEKNKKPAQEKKTLEELIEKENTRKKNTEESTEKAREKLLETEKIFSETRKTSERLKTVKALEEEAGKIEKMLSELAFDESTLQEKRKKETELFGKIEAAKSEIASSKELLEQIMKRIAGIQKTKKQVSAIEKETNTLEKSLESMSIFVNALKATQSDLREMLVETINEAMQDIWPKVYPYQDFSSAKMVIEEGSYELKVRQRNGEWVRVEGILSGGERSAAALCIRIAFSLVLTQNLSLIILDEPTHNLDSLAVQELGRMLRDYLPELVAQIFVITHDKQLEKAANASIFVLHREKGEDGITRLEQITARE